MKGEKGQKQGRNTDEVRDMITLMSDKIPGVIKGLLTSIYSEDTARSMGKAVASYYDELKAGGLPDDVAVLMTKEYLGMFRFGEMFRSGSRGIGQRVQENVRDRTKETSKQEDDE
jgi:hypothetical protein